MSGDDIWLPRPEGSAQPQPQPADRQRHALWVALAVVGLFGLAYLLMALPGMGAVTARRAVPLPSTFEESQRQQGTKVLIEEGVAADGRSYRFEVSRHVSGSLCSFLTVTSADGSGGGGGGCGPGDPWSFSTSGSGAVEGLTSKKVRTVELTLPSERVTVRTKQLPTPFAERRYFLVVLPPGVAPTRIVGRDGDGSVVAEDRLDRRPPRSG